MSAKELTTDQKAQIDLMKLSDAQVADDLRDLSLNLYLHYGHYAPAVNGKPIHFVDEDLEEARW